MRLAIYHRTTTAVRAEALFVSAVQCSDEPSGDQVRSAIAAAVRAYGVPGDGRDCLLPAPGPGGWQADEAHPFRRAEEPAGTSVAGGPACRPARSRCGPGQGAGPCPAARLIPDRPGAQGGAVTIRMAPGLAYRAGYGPGR